MKHQMPAMIKRLFLGLAIATFARAHAQAQEALIAVAPPHMSPSVPESQSASRPARADFRDKSAPAAVRQMANWVVASADNGRLPFAIVDKKDADVFVFDGQGQILGAAPALLGLAAGDDSAPGIGSKPLSAIRPSERTTPAGRFTAFMGHAPGHPNFLWVDYKNNVALHPVVAGVPKDRRLQRLATPTPLDNRITFGCINVPFDFFERTVLPAFRNTKGIVYVLPETRATREFFPNYHPVDE
jgi:hypothetical protein